MNSWWIQPFLFLSLLTAALPANHYLLSVFFFSESPHSSINWFKSSSCNRPFSDFLTEETLNYHGEISIALLLALRLTLYLIYISFNHIIIEKYLTVSMLHDPQLCHLLSFASLIVAISPPPPLLNCTCIASLG